jgi:hypothetical protein
MLQKIEVGAQTEALRRVLAQPLPSSAVADYLFLEAWERDPSDKPGVALRVGQIRRANPSLAAAIRAELSGGRNAALTNAKFPNAIVSVKMSRD